MKSTTLKYYYWLQPRHVTCSALVLALLSACGGDDGVGEPDASGGTTASGGENSASGGADATSGGSRSSGGAGTASGGQAVGDSAFGGPCIDDTECPEAPGELISFCAIGWPSGYCTATCNFTAEQQCGEGAVCDVGGLGWCLKFCTSDADCREGYYCPKNSSGCERDPRP